MKIRSYLITGACVAALTFCLPITAPAQGTKSTSASPSPAAISKTTTTSSTASSAEKPARAIPFRGTISEVDQSAKTFTIAGKTTSRVFKVTDKTTVTKQGAAATMSDINANEAVTGSYWKHEDGTLEAKTVKIGGKTDAEKATSTKKKKSKKDDAAAEEESPEE